MSLRYGSVCSGIEAATVAWHPLGWQPQFFSEIEAAPRAVLKHRWPEVLLHGDFTTIREGEYGAIDVLVGGTPCQSFSVAGLRGGLADDRGNLALQYLRLAQRLRPRWLVWENVPGVLSSSGGRDFGAIIGGMVELGYGFAYRVLDAQYVRVDGFGRAVPQRRRRVFVVGHLGDWRRPAAVLFERACLRGDPAPRREAGAGVAGTLAPGAHPGGFSGQDAHTGHIIAAPFAPAISASNPYGDHESREGLLVAHSLRGEGFDASEDGTGRGTPIVPVASTLLRGGHSTNPMEETLIAFQQGGSNIGTTGLISNTLTKGNGNESGGVPCIAFSGNDDLRDVSYELSPTLRCGGKEGGANWMALNQGWSVRRLTPTECERLQGFPDDYTLVPWRGSLMPDGPRYKALGNSMACNVMRWIGRRIEAVDALETAPVLMAAE